MALRLRPAEIMESFAEQTLSSFPVIVTSTAFAGLVVSSEIAWHMNLALGSVSMIPGVTGQFILRELGTAIPGLLLVSKVGASMAAEVGTMKITEQIDALKLLGISPVQYLVIPRWLGSIASSLCLTMVSIAVTLSCALLAACMSYGFGWLEYLNALRHFAEARDLLSAAIKALLFGCSTPLIACYFGFRCRGGADGVGQCTTQAVVTGTLAVIFIDFLVTFLFASVL